MCCVWMAGEGSGAVVRLCVCVCERETLWMTGEGVEQASCGWM